MNEYSSMAKENGRYAVVLGEDFVLRDDYATREEADRMVTLLNRRFTVRRHLQAKALDRNGQGRRYGWSDQDIDLLLKDLGVI